VTDNQPPDDAAVDPPPPDEPDEPAGTADQPAPTADQPARTRPLPALPERFEPGRARPVVRTEPEPVSGSPVTSPYTVLYPRSMSSPYGGYSYPVTPATNGMAIASLIVSMVGITSCCLPLGLIGAILGHMARGQMRDRNESGNGLALAGIIIGWLSTALMLLCCVGFLLFLGGAGLIGHGAPGN
jgi:hypothetical protein